MSRIKVRRTTRQCPNRCGDEYHWVAHYEHDRWRPERWLWTDNHRVALEGALTHLVPSQLAESVEP